MKVFRTLLIVLAIGLVLFACSHTPGEKKRTFQSPDGRYSFKILNNFGFSNSILERTENRIIEAYPRIINKYGTPTNEAKEISIILNEGEAVSFAGSNSLNLYFVKDKRNPLIHELTHVLYINVKEPVSFFPLEGLAQIVASENGEDNAYPLYSVPFHKGMNYLYKNNVYIPLSDLADANISKQTMYVREGPREKRIRQWVAYVEAASFSKYIIDQYGVDKFMAIYAKSDLSMRVKTEFGKELTELEEEWLDFVKRKQNRFTVFDRIRYVFHIYGYDRNINGFVYESK